MPRNGTLSNVADRARMITCTLHDSVADISHADWAAIVDESTDLAMDRRLIAVQQATLRGQCRMWFAFVRNGDGIPLACACLCLFKVDGAISAHPIVQRAASIARRLHSGILRMAVLFCGLPVPAGASHVRLAPHADPEAVMSCLDRTLREIAHRERASLIVFKEFGADASQFALPLEASGYESGDVPPMHRLMGAHVDFDAFLHSMRSRYRAQVQRSRRKIAANGFVIEHHVDAHAIERAMTPTLHALYERVWERSAYKLERLPREFFIEAARAMRNDAALTVIRRGSGEPVGFTFSIARGRRWHNLYSGIDYSINGEGDILFNLFYADLALAFERGCDDIHLGQTSDEFKSRLGSIAQPLRFFVRARSSIVHAGLRALAPVAFPTVPLVHASRVFKGSPSEPPRVSAEVAVEFAIAPLATCK